MIHSAWRILITKRPKSSSGTLALPFDGGAGYGMKPSTGNSAQGAAEPRQPGGYLKKPIQHHLGIANEDEKEHMTLGFLRYRLCGYVAGVMTVFRFHHQFLFNGRNTRKSERTLSPELRVTAFNRLTGTEMIHSREQLIQLVESLKHYPALMKQVQFAEYDRKYACEDVVRFGKDLEHLKDLKAGQPLVLVGEGRNSLQFGSVLQTGDFAEVLDIEWRALSKEKFDDVIRVRCEDEAVHGLIV